jgi:hypothetical protein
MNRPAVGGGAPSVPLEVFMAKSLRNYPSGVRTALIALSGGTCYYPDCREPVVRFVSGKPDSPPRGRSHRGVVR